MRFGYIHHLDRRVAGGRVTLEPGSAEWQRLVTASKIAGILGISPWADQYSTWHRMAGNLPPETTTEAMNRGNDFEDGVLKRFYREHPNCFPIPTSGETVQVSEWLAVTPDSIAMDITTGEQTLVEVKTVDRWDMWVGEDGIDRVPEHYLAQVIIMAHVLDIPSIRFAVMGPFWDYREYVVAPDAELANAILSKCYLFWQSVQSGNEPPLSRTVASYEAWTKVASAEDEGTEAEIPVEMAQRYLAALAGEKDVKPAKAEIVNVLEATGAKVAVCQGKKIAQRQRSAHGMSLVAARKLPDLLLLKESA